MSMDINKIKYIKYKKKYNELKQLLSNKNNIVNKIIILPKEYDILNEEQKSLFVLYEKTKSNKPLSYIKKKYLNDFPNTLIELDKNNMLKDSSSEEIENILEKEIISPDEYFLLNDSDKARYEIFESDYDKFQNRVVPKNYKKTN